VELVSPGQSAKLNSTNATAHLVKMAAIVPLQQMAMSVIVNLDSLDTIVNRISMNVPASLVETERRASMKSTVSLAGVILISPEFTASPQSTSVTKNRVRMVLHASTVSVISRACVCLDSLASYVRQSSNCLRQRLK